MTQTEVGWCWLLSPLQGGAAFAECHSAGRGTTDGGEEVAGTTWQQLSPSLLPGELWLSHILAVAPVFWTFPLSQDSEGREGCGNTMECFMVLSTQTQKISIGILCGLFGTMCVFENSLVLYLIFSSPGTRKKPSYLFIGSLALADILASIIFVCSFVNFHVFNDTGFSKEMFLLQLGGVNTSFCASLSSLLLTALDRYLSISRPSEYKLLMTRKRAWTALAVLWLTCATIAYLPLLGWNCCVLDSTCSELFPFVDDNYLSGWICFIVVLLGCIIYAYAHVLWRARQHVAYMEKHQAQAGKQNSRMRMDVMLAKTLVMVLAVLMLCWSPVLVLMIYSIFSKLSTHLRKVFAFCSTLCLLNSMVNPIIYALRSKELFSSLRRVVSRFRRQLKVSEESPEAESTHKSSVIETVCEDTRTI
uniref:Cannabinoid receptor 2 n=1 Tax=Malurus cyaneus samueli TaxID=2593467 RepID=A0A8C5T740_9PASS